jgi:hypothetical protein
LVETKYQQPQTPMSKEDINALTEEIRRLKIVLEAMENSITNHTNATTLMTPTAQMTPNVTGAVTELNRRAATFFAKVAPFKVGDQIIITNKVKSPDTTRGVNNRDKIGIVTKIAP